MNKSEKPVHIPLGVQARRWLPKCGKGQKREADGLVFGSLPNDTHINEHLKAWVEKAGITKAITYHTSRHTFATMLLTLGGRPLYRLQVAGALADKEHAGLRRNHQPAERRGGKPRRQGIRLTTFYIRTRLWQER